LTGILYPDSDISSLQTDKSYSIPDYPGFFYLLRNGKEADKKSEDMGDILFFRYDSIEPLIQNAQPILTVNNLTPQTCFNILRKDYYITDNIVINETGLNTVWIRIEH